MQKHYTSDGQLYTGITTRQGRKLKNAARTKSGQTVLNISALPPAELAELCGLYEYDPPTSKANGKKLGKLLFDQKKGTCTRELIDLTPEEIAEQEEQIARMEFEAEKEAENEMQFAAWKAKKGKWQKFN